MNDPRRTALVTGCSSGIGRATATMLRGRGWRVFATARSEADLARLAADGFDALALDLDSSASIRLALAHLLAATGGRIDALVNNAAYGQPGAVEDLSRDALRRQFESNVFGTIELTNLVIPVMREARAGRIVFVSSILGLVPMAMRGAYCGSKYALEGLVGALRLELRDTGIEVATINPGAIESRFREHAIAAAEREVDFEGSVHADRYARLRAMNNAPGGKMPLSLPPEKVAEKIVHALESSSPGLRYLVTTPAHLLAFANRILPLRWMDAFLSRR